MKHSVAREVATRGTIILVTTLVVVGAATAVVLHMRQLQSLDEALLAAAHGRAHPTVDERVEVEHSRLPYATWLVQPGDSLVPADLTRRARHRERPIFVTLDHQRVVLLPFEVEQGRDHFRGVAAASAPQVTLARSVGLFGLVYALLAAFAAGVGSFVQTESVRRAFRPLDRARREAASVLGLGEGQRLTEAGPVEVRSLLVAVNDLLDRLATAHAAQARFTAEAAHELRTPVTAMLGELDVALRSQPSLATCRDVLASTREEVARLWQLVDGLTALARIDAGQVHRDPEPIRAAELASRAMEREMKTLTEAGNTLRLQVDADPEFEGHGALLETALANLLRNAARHAPGTEVVLRVDGEAAHAVFEVDDAGPGVSAESRDGLFDRFARAGDARQRDPSGLGLGLPIAREVARRHGGDCVLGDSDLGGLRVRLTVQISAA